MPAGVRVVTVGSQPCASVPGGGAMWVSNFGDNTISRIDPATDRVTATYRVGSRPCGIVYVAGRLWVGLVGGQEVVEVDPATGKVLAEISVDGPVYDVQAGYGSVWANDYMGGDVVRIDPRTAKVVATTPTGKAIYGLAVTPEGVWAADSGASMVERIDPATNRVVARVPSAAGAPYTFAYTRGALWLAVLGATVRLDAASGRAVATLKRSGIGTGPGDPDVLGGLVYVPAVEEGSLLVIDPRSNKIVRRLALGSGYSVAQAGFGAMWVCRFSGNTVARVDPALLR